MARHAGKPAFWHTSAGNTCVRAHQRWKYPRLGAPRWKYLRFDTPAPETPACWHTSAGKPAFGRTTLEIPAFGHRRRARDRVLRRLSWRRGCGVYEKQYVNINIPLSIYIYIYKAPVEVLPGHDATGATYMSRLRVERAPVAPDDAHAASLLFAAPAGVAARSQRARQAA